MSPRSRFRMVGGSSAAGGCWGVGNRVMGVLRRWVWWLLCGGSSRVVCGLESDGGGRGEEEGG